MKRSSAGFTLMEMLAVVAIVGLLAMTGMGLVTSLLHAAEMDGVAASEADRRLMTLRRFRAEVMRSRKVTLDGARLRLWSAEPDVVVPGWSYVGSDWCVRDGVLVGAGAGGEDCDASAIRVRTLRHGSVVELDLKDYGRVVALVGGGPP